MRANDFRLWTGFMLLLLFLSPAPAPANELIVSRNSLWKFHNLGQDLGGTGWQALGYDDSGWGGPLPGPLGDNQENGTQLCASVIDIGPSGERFPIVYFRRTL